MLSNWYQYKINRIYIFLENKLSDEDAKSVYEKIVTILEEHKED